MAAAGQRAAWWEANHPKAEHGGDRKSEEIKFVKGKLDPPLPAGITPKMLDQMSSLRRNAPALHVVGAGYRRDAQHLASTHTSRQRLIAAPWPA